MKEIRKTAKDRMEGFCRVCPVCDGRVCAGEVPGMGGVGTGSSFKANIEALSNIQFNMKVIHNIVEPDTRVSIFGETLDLPVFAAPIGGVSFNMGGKISEEDYINSVIQGCHEEGVIGCTGDGVADIIHQAGFSAIKSVEGRGIPFIKPWEDIELLKKLEEAADTGTSIVGMDIDAAGLVTLRLMGRPVTPKPPEKLKEIINQTKMKFILKGIMTADEAKLAVDVGASGIVVSNHGGRVLDYTPGVAQVLPDIVHAVKGQITILCDGGIRSGGDVLKVLALGADAAMIGRPFSVAAVGGLKSGVIKYIRQIKSQLIETMILTGCKNIPSIDRSILFDK